MNSDERNALIATTGLVVAAVGTFLPWARIGGRNRSGFSTADTFIGLAEGALPDQIAWVGRWWYLPAALVVLAWATTFFTGRRLVRVGGVASLTIGLVMWWLFVWAGRYYNVLDSQFIGPVVTTIGMGVVAVACWRKRGSLVRPAN